MIRLRSDGPFRGLPRDVIRSLQDSGDGAWAGLAKPPNSGFAGICVSRCGGCCGRPRASVPEPCPVAQFGPGGGCAKAGFCDGVAQRHAPAGIEREHPRDRPQQTQQRDERGERGDHDAARGEPTGVSEVLRVWVDHDKRMLGAGTGAESQACERRKRVEQDLLGRLVGVDHADPLGFGASEILV
jgi:hypothetical protein